jgi:predicted lactoylglutathione lyase
MAVPNRITLVTLGVADVARARAFYESLGWTASSASVEGEVAFFATVGPALSLYGIDDLARDASESPERRGFGGVTIAINVDSPEEVDRLYAEWVAAGGASKSSPVKAEWGGYIAFVADLDGYVWELAHNPYWSLNDDGSLTLPD